jgi:hypothetical protein
MLVCVGLAWKTGREEEDRQTQTEVADDVECRIRLENSGYKKMEAHSKRQNRMGRHRKGGKSPARAVKPEKKKLVLQTQVSVALFSFEQN